MVCIVNSVQCTLYSVQCAVFSIQCTSFTHWIVDYTAHKVPPQHMKELDVQCSVISVHMVEGCVS